MSLLCIDRHSHHWLAIASILVQWVRLVWVLTWLLREHSVQAPQRVCQAWLEREWSSSGALTTLEQVEEALGARLRLERYRQEFLTDDAARMLSEILAESQPPFKVNALLLRQWYSALLKEWLAVERVTSAWELTVTPKHFSPCGGSVL